MKPSILASLIFCLSASLSITVFAETKPAQTGNDNAPIPVEPPNLPHEASFQWGPEESAQDLFNKMDKNKDNRISFDELVNYQYVQKELHKKEEYQRIQKSCDKNNDGIISKDEFSPEKNFFAMMQGEIPPVGTKAPDAFLKNACMLPPFALDIMDFDENGILTIDEVKKAIMSDGPPTQKAKEKVESKMHQMEAKQKSGQFKKCDSNQDQLLSFREAMSAKCHIVSFTEEFDTYDTNGDQYLSLEESTKYVKPVMLETDLPPIEALKNMPPLVRIEMALHECDKNDNQRLNKNETLTPRCNVDVVLFDKIDHNQDSAIDQDEMQRMHSKENFDRNDKNNDGYLDKLEFKSEMIW